MSCDMANEFLSAYLDGELGPAQMDEIASHIENCTECADELAVLKAGRAAVGQLVEYGMPRAFETELRRRINEYRPARSRWLTLGGRLDPRVIKLGICLLCGVLLLAGAAYLRSTTSPTPQPVTKSIKSVSVPAATESPSQKPPSRQNVSDTKPAATPQRVVKPTPDVTKPSKPVVPPSPYTGWWMMRVETRPEFEYPVNITQNAAYLVVTAWGAQSPLGKAKPVGGLFESQKRDLYLTLDFGQDSAEFSGTIERSDVGPIRLNGYRVPAETSKIFDRTHGLDDLIGKRVDFGRQLSNALYAYARVHNDLFPTALADLTPEFMPAAETFDEDLKLVLAGHDTVYARPVSRPTDELVDWTAYAVEELTVDEQFDMLRQRRLGLFDAFFEEMAVVEWTEFPAGRVIIYLDGSVAYDGMKDVPKLLMPKVFKQTAVAREKTCLTNIRRLGRALLSFSDDHGGLFPLTLDMLWPTYLKDANLLTCPERPPHEIAFDIPCLGKEYPTDSEIESDPDILSTIVLAVETENSHRNGFHIVTADGQATWKPGYDR